MRLFMGTALASALALWVAQVGQPAFAQGAAPGAGQDISSKTVSINLENADIRYALKLLFQSVGADYTVDSSVQGSVTMSVTNKPLRVALDALLRSTASTIPLTYRYENGIYQIAPKIEQIEPVATPEEGKEPTAASRRFRVIRVSHVDATTMAEMLSTAGAYVTTVSGFPMGQDYGYSNMGGGGYGSNVGGWGGGLGGYGTGFSGNNSFGGNSFGGNSFGGYGSFGGFGSTSTNGLNFGSAGGNWSWGSGNRSW